MKILPLSFSAVVVAAAAFLALAGCATAPDSPAKETTSAAAAKSDAKPAKKLRRGMKPAEVRAMLGEPTEVNPHTGSDRAEETWFYRRQVGEHTGQKVTGTQELPYVDPMTGDARTMMEPVYTTYTAKVIEELTLYWKNGELVDWKARRREVESFNQ